MAAGHPPLRDTNMVSVKQDLDEANKLFALKRYDSASDLIASALESLYVNGS